MYWASSKFVIADADFTGDRVVYDPVFDTLKVDIQGDDPGSSGPGGIAFEMSDVFLQPGFDLAGGSFDTINGNSDGIRR